MHETLEGLYEVLGLDYAHTDQNFDLLASADSRYLRDLKINVGNVLQSSQNISKQEAALMAFAVAVNERNTPLKTAFAAMARREGANEEALSDMVACASLLASNNVFYRFRHFMNKETYNTRPAGLKMSIMGNPSVGKEFFELVSLAISAVNGCEMCVGSHEESVKNHGADEARVFDSIKLAATIRALSVATG